MAHGYWRVEYCPDYMYTYPRVTVFAPNKRRADLIAGEDRFDERVYRELATDAMEALSRLAYRGEDGLQALG